MPAIVISHRGMAVRGVPAGALRDAIRALSGPYPLLVRDPMTDRLGEAVAMLAVELRAAGQQVHVVVAPDSLLLHKRCPRHRAYGYAEWAANVRPHWMDSLDGREGWFEMLTCECGSTISLASMELVARPRAHGDVS